MSLPKRQGLDYYFKVGKLQVDDTKLNRQEKERNQKPRIGVPNEKELFHLPVPAEINKGTKLNLERE